jgi:microcystin-dependent protein
MTNANAGPTDAAAAHENTQPVMCIRFLIKT